MATALGNDRIIGGPAPTGKTSSASKKAPGKAAKLRLGAASNETRAVARAGMPTATHLMRDDNDEDVDVATAIKRGLAMAAVLGNDRIIGGLAPAGKTSSASSLAAFPGAGTNYTRWSIIQTLNNTHNLTHKQASDKTWAVARAGMPTDDDKRGDKATSTMPTKPRKGGRMTPVGKSWQDGAWEGRQATPRGGVRQNTGGRKGGNAHSNAPHEGRRR
jgi:hypothetical protein